MKPSRLFKPPCNPEYVIGDFVLLVGENVEPDVDISRASMHVWLNCLSDVEAKSLAVVVA